MTTSTRKGPSGSSRCGAVAARTSLTRALSRTPARGRPKLDLWFTPLVLGQPLPSLPLWLAEDTVVNLDLDPPYEAACRVLYIA